MAEHLTEYEKLREITVAKNRAMMESCGLMHAVKQVAISASYRPAKKTAATRMVKPRSGPVVVAMKRRSKRLLGHVASADYVEVDEDGLKEEGADLIDLIDRTGSGAQAGTSSSGAEERVSGRCCASDSRGGPYCSRLGLCCHFCRQKRTCAGPDCPRCRSGNVEAECTGKTACSRCQSATGVHCAGCLQTRYGQTMDDARAAMAAGTWLCAHCYEEEHPQEGWFCNASFCMKKRGHKATGIAIYVALENGFSSVAHYLQDQTLKAQAAAQEVAAMVEASASGDAAASGAAGGSKSAAAELAAPSGPAPPESAAVLAAVLGPVAALDQPLAARRTARAPRPQQLAVQG